MDKLHPQVQLLYCSEGSGYSTYTGTVTILYRRRWLEYIHRYSYCTVERYVDTVFPQVQLLYCKKEVAIVYPQVQYCSVEREMVTVHSHVQLLYCT